MVELVDTTDLKSVVLRGVPVRVRLEVFAYNKRLMKKFLSRFLLLKRAACPLLAHFHRRVDRWECAYEIKMKEEIIGD